MKSCFLNFIRIRLPIAIIKHMSTISSLFILRNDWRGHESKQGVNIAKLDIKKGVYLLGAIFQLLL